MHQKFLPLFPLSLVVYPNEDLNLHVFEPRYKQLINDCIEQKINFGIPSFIEGKVTEYGTEVKVISIEKTYDDGKLDIKTKGICLFKMLNFEQEAPEKLYAGGQVEIIPNEEIASEEMTLELKGKVKKLYDILKISASLTIQSFRLFSYQLAHKIGLSLPQQYELLQITNEQERQFFLLEHLNNSIPLMEEMEKTKELIKMNGHFKNFDPLDFS